MPFSSQRGLVSTFLGESYGGGVEQNGSRVCNLTGSLG